MKSSRSSWVTNSWRSSNRGPPCRRAVVCRRLRLAVLGAEIEKVEYTGMTLGSFPHKDGEAAGCLYTSQTVRPSADGPLIYLNVHGRLDEGHRYSAEQTGGKVLQKKESIGPSGFRAILLDTEGNRIALHSM